jgi:endonuclease IV
LQTLHLWAEGFDSVKVDAILNSLQHFTKLDYLRLWHANITKEQKKRMNAKGVNLDH